MEFIKEHDRVLYLWGGKMVTDIENQVNQLKNVPNVTVNVENVERLGLASYPKSTFDVVLSNLCSSGADHSQEFLSLVIKLVKLNGRFVLKDDSMKLAEMTTNLKFTGFVHIEASTETSIITCKKPNYEVGSAAKLSFAGKLNLNKAAVEKVWKIDAEDEELIDEDELLDEEDLKKPDPETLRVCGTTGKRKACKDCSCGLADELANENGAKVSNPTQKSSCGSCYLGDAFRCGTCPYLGMPAFKPGEKIQLGGNLLKADV